MAIIKIQPYILDETQNFTFANVTITANTTSGNANLGNAATANFFIGNGSLLTGIAGTYSNADVANYLPTYTGNVAAGNVLTNNLLYANGVAWSFGSSYSNTNVAAYLPTYTSNLTAGNILGANLISGNFLTGTLTTAAQPNITSVGTLSSLSVTANVSAGNILTDNLLYANGTLWNLSGSYSNTNVAAYLPTYTGNFTAGNANVTGNITAGNLITSGSGGNITGANVISATTFTATGNISSGNANLGNAVTANFFIGNGSLLTGLPASYSNTNVAAYLPTYTGNLTAGNANLGNAVTANFFMGNGSLLTGLPASYSNTNVAAYLPTYTGNFTANNIVASNNINASSITTTGSSGNISGANYVIANFFSGNGSLLTSIAGGNITGQVANALVAGTVYTNAQPNITSVGTLSSLSVTANVSAGNILTDNLLYANGVTWTFGSTYSNTNVAAYLPTYTGNISANYYTGDGSLLTGITATVAQTVSNAAQPNITSVGTLSGLTVSGNLSFTGANAYFSNVGNLKILGGNNNQVLSTDGTGNLSWITSTSANMTVDTFSANGNANSFTLSTSPTDANYVFVNINGVFQFRDAYSLAGNVITLGSTPTNGSTIEVSAMNVGASSGGGGTNTSVVYTMGLIFGG